MLCHPGFKNSEGENGTYIRVAGLGHILNPVGAYLKFIRIIPPQMSNTDLFPIF